MSYKKNIASNFVFQIIKIALGFVTSIVIARALGAQGQGEYSYLILIFGLLGSYGHGGILNATTYFYKRTNYEDSEVFSTNLIYCLVNSLILILVISFLKYKNIFLDGYNNGVLLIGLIYIMFSYSQTLLNSLYIGSERIHEANIYKFYGHLIYFFLLLILFFFKKLNVMLVVVLNLLNFVVGSILLLSKLNIKFVPKINYTLLKAEFKYGVIVYFSSLFIFLNYRADQFMIKFYLNTTDLGIYSIAVKLAELLFLIPDSITTALSGHLYNMEVDDTKSQKSVLAKTSKYTFYASLILCVVGIFMTPLVPYVYGEEFVRTKSTILILFIGIIFASIGKVSYSYFFTRGQPQIHLYITAATLTINIILNSFFIPKWGIDGAAFASTISYIFYGLAYLIVFKVKEGIPFRDFFYVSRKEISDIMNIFKARLKKSHSVE